MDPKLARGEDVPIEITDPRVRAARLRRLPVERFVPPHPATMDAAFAADVRAFAAAFWALPPAERRARWRELAGCPVGAAAARLGDLEPGLGVTHVAQPDPRAAELAELVRELFVLPPAERAARRVAWLTAADRRDAKWVAASRTVLRTDLPLARLEERLFDWFSLRDRPAAVAAVAESAARVSRPGLPVSEPVPEPAPAAGGLGCLSGPGAIIFALIVIVRIIIAVSGPSRSPAPTYTPPAYTPAPNTWRPPAPDAPTANPWQPIDAQPLRQTDVPPFPDSSFSAREVAAFDEYEAKKRSGQLRPGEAPPPRYDRWVELGGPELRGRP